MYGVSRGHGRPVVFLHGLGWDHTLWDGAMEGFAGRYQTVAADSRGHGRTDKPDGPYSIGCFANDWTGLATGLGVDRVCLVGFSLGGMIAMQMALDQPELVEALVLVSTLCGADSQLLGKLEERIETAKREGPLVGAQAGARQIFSPRFMAEYPERVESFVRWRADMAQEPIFAAARASNGFDVCSRLSELQVPCLVMYAEDDVITPPSMAQTIIYLPETEVVAFPDNGHVIPVERPTQFEMALDDFLTRRYPPVPR